jgi:hypothetical protein
MLPCLHGFNLPFLTALRVKGRQADIAWRLSLTCDRLHRAFLCLYSLGMSNATFARPDLTTFTRLDELGLEVVGQRTASSEALNCGLSSIGGYGDTGDDHSSGDGQIRAQERVGGDGKVDVEGRLLTAETLTPYTRGPVTVLPIRWITDGARDSQLSLDANLEFGPSENDATTQLLLVGVFRPMTRDSQIEYYVQERISRKAARHFLTKIAALVGGPPTKHDTHPPIAQSWRLPTPPASAGTHHRQ